MSFFRNDSSGLALAAAILLLAAAISYSQAATWPAEQQVARIHRMDVEKARDFGQFSRWIIVESEDLSAPVLGFGRPIPVPDRDVRTALDLVTTAFDVHADFEIMQTRTVHELTRAHFREVRDGLPVLAGGADIVLNARGELMRWSLREHEDWPVRDNHLLDMNTAAASLEQDHPMQEWRIETEYSFAYWYPDVDNRILRPVYWIRSAGRAPDERWEGIVDAVTGEVILDWPGIETDVISGTVQSPYWQPYDFSDPQIAPDMYATVTINGNEIVTDSTGHFAMEAGSSAELSTELRGPYVYAQNDDAPDGLMTMSLNTPFPEITWTWSDEDAAVPEMNLFHHTTFIHDWYKVLDPDFSALDYPVPAVANYGNHYDNAFWNGHGTYYGSGGQYHNFAMFSDVIYHEYTHGVTDGIYPDGMLPYIDQPGAMNEAWSDYIASTINGDPYMAEWIRGSFNSWFRNLDNNLVFPQNWFGEVHADSRFVSGALWEIRGALGADIADDLAHYARYGLAETFFDYLVAVLETDDNDGDLSNGTPHSTTIYEAFGRHGIGPGDDPHFAVEDLRTFADGSDGSSGDGDRYVEQGETAGLVFTLANEAELFPPPATDVHLTVSSADENVTIENAEQTYAELAPGGSVVINPVLIHVSPQSPDHWAVVDIHVSANGGDATYDHQIEFTIGTPRLLVVKDDAETDVERFVTAGLRVQDRIFEQVELAADQSLDDSLLPRPGLVIWLSGNAEGEILTENDQNLLQSYLESGNRVVLSGQNIVDDLSGTSFFQNILQVGIETPSLINFSATADASPFEPGEWFLLTGAQGAGNQREETSFEPYGDSHAVAHYGLHSEGPTAIVEFEFGRGLLFGFGIEAISGVAPESSDLADLMDRLYAWASDVLPTEPERLRETISPNEWSLGPAYPNPFNGQTTIDYAIPSIRGGVLFIYDLMGRAVDVQRLSDAKGTVVWSPKTASGMYFAQLKWDGGKSKPIKLQFLK